MLVVFPLLALLGWAGFELSREPAPAENGNGIPTTTVRRGDVLFTITAKGHLQGGNSEMLTAPRAGGREMVITYLRDPGELVEAGDTVVQFDITELEYELREAEADLAETEQQVSKARAESAATEEETRYALIHAEAQVRLAEYETRKNPLVASITARQNDLALEAARDRLNQLQQDIANREATNLASIAMQEAARNKASVKAETARRDIEAMTLKADKAGYVAVQQNTRSNFVFWGMQFPILQVGDTVRAGVPVALIPDLENWEVAANIGELDRGHLGKDQPVAIRIIAVPEAEFHGKVINIGGTTGPPWDRRFECKISLANPDPALRQGMSARIVVETGKLEDVLWVPSQALFESDGRTFVYVKNGSGFEPHDVELVRRSESQVVLKGVEEGQVVTLASPDQQAEEEDEPSGSVMEALPQT
ncbi:MAG: HlyD family efflux transporter periplasmic adaptor subunit [bacterium]|nr:HlyD family efflux transporter periplasmic adaptor subunit [bacterium]